MTSWIGWHIRMSWPPTHTQHTARARQNLALRQTSLSLFSLTRVSRLVTLLRWANLRNQDYWQSINVLLVGLQQLHAIPNKTHIPFFHERLPYSATAICSLLSFSFPSYSFFTIIDSIFFVLFLFERLPFISLLCSLAGPCSRYIISYVVVRTCRDVYVSSTSMTSLSFMALQFDRSGWKVGRIVERQRSSCH